MNPAQEALKTAVEETFETMFFLDVSEASELDGVDPDPAYLSCFLPVLRPVPLELKLLLSRPLLNYILEFLFAGQQDARASETIVRDIAAEVLNMIAGRFMTYYGKEGEDFELGLPVILEAGTVSMTGPVLAIKIRNSECFLQVHFHQQEA